MSPPQLPMSGCVCSQDLFLPHTPRLTLSSPVVLSRIALTSCHSPSHPWQAARDPCPVLQAGELVHRLSPCKQPWVPLSGSSRENRTHCLPSKAPCSRTISAGVISPHRSAKPFLLAVSDTPGAAPHA